MLVKIKDVDASLVDPSESRPQSRSRRVADRHKPIVYEHAAGADFWQLSASVLWTMDMIRTPSVNQAGYCFGFSHCHFHVGHEHVAMTTCLTLPP
jgi:hypothetical protein